MKSTSSSITEKSLYFIAISPIGRTKERIDDVKEDIYQKFGLKGAFRSPPHITLQMPFKKTPTKIKAIIEDLEEFAKDFSPFHIALDGFNCFPPRVVYIEVVHNEILNEIQHQLVKVMKAHQILFANYKNQAYHPHITVAFRDMKKKVFPQVWETYKEQELKESFLAEGITLYKHNGKIWEEDQFFPFNPQS